MAQPLRKIFQKNLLPGADASGRGRAQEGVRAPLREGRGGGRRRTLDLSGAAAAALGLALVAAVGWAFFMGYLVGRGEHPERGVESVAGLLRPGAPATGAAQARRAPLPGEEALAPVATDSPEAGLPARPEGAPVPAGGDTPQAAPALPPQGAHAAGGAPASETAPPAAPPASGSAASAYPFNRPQGESLAAWGRAPDATQAQAGRSAPGQTAQKPAAAAAPAQPRNAAPPPQPAEPRFDYLFQAAAFKGPVDAERLRGRLEAAGLRASVRQSGKVRLVLVSLRGSAKEAQRLRGQLAGMGLGRPIQLEKKPVAEKTGGKSRRRSAP